jgi:hypothetical protein
VTQLLDVHVDAAFFIDRPNTYTNTNSSREKHGEVGIIGKLGFRILRSQSNVTKPESHENDKELWQGRGEEKRRNYW